MPSLFFEITYLALKHTEFTTLTLRGHVTSSLMWYPIWYPYAISYRCSIVAKSLAVFEINGPKHFGGHDPDLWGSRDVTDHVTNRFAIGHRPFRTVVHWHRASTFNRFLRYSHLKWVTNLTFYFFGVTLRHQSCDHLIPHMPFPAVFETMGPNILGSSITWPIDSI